MNECDDDWILEVQFVFCGNVKNKQTVGKLPDLKSLLCSLIRSGRFPLVSLT